MNVEPHIRRLNLSYFELIDPAIRVQVVEMFEGQRQYDWPDRREITAAMDRLRDEMHQ
jgi:hypothetical protein